MSTLDLLFGASYKGARFLARGAVTTEGGRKLIDHEYPNTDRRFIEDLGKKTRDFTITGVVTGPNYFAKRNALVNALEESGRGRFIHPFFGSITVVARPYSLVEDLTRVNEGVFTMNFSIPSENIYPEVVDIINISGFIAGIRSAIADFLDINFNLINAFGDTLLSAENLLNDVFDAFDDLTRNFNQISENISALKKTIANARNKIAQILRAPELLFDFLEDVFDSINNLFDDPKEALKTLVELFIFSAGDETRAATTVIKQEQNEVRDTVNAAVNALALANAYEIATQVEFTSDQELEAFLVQFDEQFEYVNELEILDETTRESIIEARDQFRTIADNLLQTIDRIITVKAQDESVTNLAYRYYGSLDRYDNIISQNNIINPALVNGNIDIFTNV